MINNREKNQPFKNPTWTLHFFNKKKVATIKTPAKDFYSNKSSCYFKDLFPINTDIQVQSIDNMNKDAKTTIFIDDTYQQPIKLNNEDQLNTDTLNSIINYYKNPENQIKTIDEAREYFYSLFEKAKSHHAAFGEIMNGPEKNPLIDYGCTLIPSITMRNNYQVITSVKLIKDKKKIADTLDLGLKSEKKVILKRKNVNLKIKVDLKRKKTANKNEEIFSTNQDSVIEESQSIIQAPVINFPTIFSSSPPVTSNSEILSNNSSSMFYTPIPEEKKIFEDEELGLYFEY